MNYIQKQYFVSQKRGKKLRYLLRKNFLGVTVKSGPKNNIHSYSAYTLQVISLVLFSRAPLQAPISELETLQEFEHRQGQIVLNFESTSRM